MKCEDLGGKYTSFMCKIWRSTAPQFSSNEDQLGNSIWIVNSDRATACIHTYKIYKYIRNICVIIYIILQPHMKVTSEPCVLTYYGFIINVLGINTGSFRRQDSFTVTICKIWINSWLSTGWKSYMCSEMWLWILMLRKRKCYAEIIYSNSRRDLLKCHSETSTVQPLKFGNRWIISSNNLLGMWLVTHAGIKVQPY